MEKIEQQILDALKESKNWCDTNEGFVWKIDDTIALTKLKGLMLKIVQDLHDIDGIKNKEKKELEIILELQSA